MSVPVLPIHAVLCTSFTGTLFPCTFITCTFFFTAYWMCDMPSKQFLNPVARAVAVVHGTRAFKCFAYSSPEKPPKQNKQQKPTVGGYNFLRTLLLHLGYVFYIH